MLTHQFEKAKNLQQHIVHAPSTSGFPSPLFSRLLWTHHDPRSLHTWLGARFFSVGHLVKTLLDSRTRLVKSTGAEWWQSCDRYCETLKSHLNSGSFFLNSTLYHIKSFQESLTLLPIFYFRFRQFHFLQFQVIDRWANLIHFQGTPLILELHRSMLNHLVENCQNTSFWEHTSIKKLQHMWSFICRNMLNIIIRIGISEEKNIRYYVCIRYKKFQHLNTVENQSQERDFLFFLPLPNRQSCVHLNMNLMSFCDHFMSNVSI